MTGTGGVTQGTEGTGGVAVGVGSAQPTIMAGGGAEVGLECTKLPVEVCVCVRTCVRAYVRACVPGYKHVHTYCISVCTTILSVVRTYIRIHAYTLHLRNSPTRC